MQKKSKIKTHKIIHLSSVHKSFDIRIFHKECKSLAKKGYNVSLISPHDKNEVIDRVRLIPIKKDLNRFYRMIRTTWGIYKKALLEGGSVYHFHDPELIPIGIFLKMKGKKVIYDVHENVPDQILDKTWIPFGIRKMTSWMIGILEWMASRCFFDGVVAATATIAKRFPMNKTIIVHNFPLKDFYSQKGSPIPYSQRLNIVAYVGVITEQRGINEIVKGIDLVPKDLGVKLYLAGNFTSENLLLKIQKLPGWEQVNFFGWEPSERVINLLGHSRIGLITIYPTKSYIKSVPNKLFEYMAAGIPVIASNFQLWKPIIEKHECGILVDPLNPEEIAQAIQWLLENPKEAENMGRRGREAVLHSYNWGSEEKKLFQFYQRIIA